MVESGFSRKQDSLAGFSLKQAESPGEIAQARELFVEYAKSLIDRLHGWHLDDGLKHQAMTFAQSTFGIFIYLNLIVIEKRPIGRPFHVRVGRG